MNTRLIVALSALLLWGCGDVQPNADQVQRAKQEKALSEAVAEVGEPEITNFQEKRMMKMLYELRDQAIATHAYIVNQMSGCLVYLGESVGYGIPYATQYSNPDKWEWAGNGGHVMPQAEPNGLFMPNDAHGTWVMIKDPHGLQVKPVYIEPDVIVSPFRLTDRECK